MFQSLVDFLVVRATVMLFAAERKIVGEVVVLNFFKRKL